MKKILILFLCVLFVSTAAYGGFDWGSDCESGSGEFTQKIDYRKSVVVGEIPANKANVHINLKSPADVDIQLFDKDTGHAIVAWPNGDLRGPSESATSYQGVIYVYSGYNGVNGIPGNEYIQINGVTNRALLMKAYGYADGEAFITYSWETTNTCNEKGSGSFTQYMPYYQVTEIGIIPAGKVNVDIYLRTGNRYQDIDIQLFDGNIPIVQWPDGKLNGSNAQRLEYEGMLIEWSGYGGTKNWLGNEYIKIRGILTKDLTIKAFAFRSGNAQIIYEWGVGAGDICYKLSDEVIGCKEGLLCKNLVLEKDLTLAFYMQEHLGWPEADLQTFFRRLFQYRSLFSKMLRINAYIRPFLEMDFNSPVGDANEWIYKGECHTNEWCLNNNTASIDCQNLVQPDTEGEWTCEQFTCIWKSMEHKPVCMFEGTFSEGWYWADIVNENPHKALIMYAQCSEATEPECDAIGSRSEGWYAENWIDTNQQSQSLIIWDNCHQSAGISLSGEKCGEEAGLTCYSGLDLTCKSDICRDELYCEEATVEEDCKNVIHPAVPGYWVCLENSCAWQQEPPPQPLCGAPQVGYSVIRPEDAKSDDMVGKNVQVTWPVSYNELMICTLMFCTEDNPCCNICSKGASFDSVPLQGTSDDTFIGCTGTECEVTCEYEEGTVLTVYGTVGENGVIMVEEFCEGGIEAITIDSNNQTVKIDPKKPVVINLSRGPLHPCYSGEWLEETMEIDETVYKLAAHREILNPECPPGLLGCTNIMDQFVLIPVGTHDINTTFQISMGPAPDWCENAGEPKNTFKVNLCSDTMCP